MSRSVALNHIIRHDDGTSTGVWGLYTLKSAFQPIFAFREGRLSAVAFEGLIRPFRDGVPQSPAAFFDACEGLDRLHVETLTRTLHLLNAGACLPPEASIFVNFDPSVFVDRNVCETALRDMRLTLHEAAIEPGRVVCEVTERPSASQEALHVFVETLRADGFRIAIDDFGAEESDIGRIKALKPDIVKFDARWIGHLMETGTGFALLATMVESFEGQGIRTVFEGIEENWQLELAEKAGVSMVQGFVLARPELASTGLRAFGKGSVAAPDAAAGAETGGQQPAREGRQPKAFGRRTAQ